jgi:hypothetical protein
MTRPSGRSILLILTGVLAVFAGFVALTGGIDTRLGGIAVRSRSWERPAALAALLGVVALIQFRREVQPVAVAAWRVLAAAGARVPRWLPVLAVCWTVYAAWSFGTFAIGGSDSYGYVSQAELFARGRLTDDMPLHPAFAWPDDIPWTLTPLGYTRNHTRGTLAPTYPPGFPLMMAPLARISSAAVFLVVPICAAIAVWCCWRLGRELEEPLAGTLAATLLSVSPTFLYQAAQPMSDVPATVCWMGALLLARRRSLAGASLAGLLAGLAILVRPNLAPLGLMVTAAAATVPDTPRLRRCAVCVASMIPAVVLLGWIQQVRYDSPLASGYGPFAELFSTSNIAANLSRYPRWLIETHTPFIWVWLCAPIWIVRAPARVRSFAWVCYAFTAAVVAAYLPYVYFQPDEWSYTRFVLPALPFMLVFGVLLVLAAARLVSARRAHALVITLCLGLAVWLAVRAKSVGAFDLRQGELKYPEVGRFVRDRLPSSAFVLAAQHSGSVRYYGGRPILRWDLLGRTSLDPAIASLRRAGYEPFVVVDVDEEPVFRKRFLSGAQASVDRLEAVATLGSTSVYGFK